ncbi:hypothetical protein AHAS_Ahas20G0186900 [Arachis hypogaea]
MEFNSSYDQTNFMGYYPPSPIFNGGWEYHQENTKFEHSNPWRFVSETQDEQENQMGYLPPPQNDASCYSNGGWEEQNQKTFENPYSTYQEPSSLERAFNSLMQNCPTSPSSFSSENSSSLDYASTQKPSQDSQPTQTSTSQRFSMFESRFNRLVEKQQQFWRELEIISQETDEQLEDTEKYLELRSKENEDQLMDVKDKVEEQDEEATASSELSMKNEAVENKTALEVIEEHETSLPKELMGNHKEDMEEDTQENSHSSEVEKCTEEELRKPPIQEALDEKKTPTITQPPRLGFKEVKAINKSTKKRIVTKLPRTTFKRRSTTNNPVPHPASKINQAICKRKLADERPRQGTLAESSPPLRSFLLTNWKKRKKVKNNMSS